MAGTNDPEPKLTGLSKYFNSVTDRGRRNVSLSTLCALALVGAYFYFKPKEKKTTQ